MILLLAHDRTNGFFQWDTAGQEMYDSISSMYIKNGDGIFLLYDISARVIMNRYRIRMIVLANFHKSREMAEGT